MNPFFNSMIKQITEAIKEVGIAIGTHVWLNRRAREGQEGEVKPGEKSKYYDEGVLLRAYADLADQLKSFGQPADEVNRIIAEVADFFGNPANSTPKEAETFRLSIAAMALEDISNVWRQLNLFAESDAAGKKALAAQLARPTLFEEWITKTYIEAGRVWDRTVQSVLTPATALEVNTFLRTIGPVESFQFTHSLGRIEDDAARVRLIEEVIHPPAGHTSIEVAQARGLINISQVRKFREWLGRNYNRLAVLYRGWLDRHQAATRAWADRGADIANHPPGWNVIAHGINFFRR